MRKIREWLVENWPNPIDSKGRPTLSVWVSLVFLLVLLSRLALHLTNPQLWAEDGKIFFMGAYEHGVSSVLMSYAGYCHLMPRLIAWITSCVFPLEFVPAVYFWSSVLIVFLIGACWLNASWLDRRIRIVMAFSLVLLPSSGETFGNITNLHWFLSSLIVLVLISPAVKNVRQACGCVLAVVMAGMSGPTICAFSPFFWWRYVVRRQESRFETIVFLFATGVTFSQILLILLCSGTVPALDSQEPMTPFLWVQIVLQIPVGLLLGRWLPPIMLTNGFLLACGTLLCGGAVVVLLWSYFSLVRQERNVVRFLFLCGGVALGLSSYRYLNSPRHFSPFEADRYFHVAYSLWFAVIGLLAVFNRVRLVKWPVWLSLVLVLVGSAGAFWVPVRLDSNWKEHIREYHDVGMTTIPIAPDPQRWAITLKR